MKFLALIIGCLLLANCARHPSLGSRDPKWARPLDCPDLENFYQVSPTLYRSGQPTSAGLRSIRSYGIATVVSLRAFHSDRALLPPDGLDYERIAFHTWDPDETELVRFLRTVTDPKKTPVLVHCLHGSDRTGAMCAAYRVIVQAWSKDEAIREMKQGGFGHHLVWSNLERWIRSLNVREIRRQLASQRSETHRGSGEAWQNRSSFVSLPH